MRISTGWRLAEALASHPGLAIVPHQGHELWIAGELQIDHEGPTGMHIETSYEVEIRVHSSFPQILPTVYETGEKIQPTFHRLRDGALCLGSLVGQRVQLGESRALGQFIDHVLIPYLYGHAYLERVGTLPFGELAHGVAGLEDDVRKLLRLPTRMDVGDVLRLAAKRRRTANKRPCPCGGGRRLGRCHHEFANHARAVVGRRACLEQARQIEQQRQLEVEEQRPERRSPKIR